MERGDVKMADLFYTLLLKKEEETHAETWKTHNTPEWKYAKDKEILIGEIIKAYEKGARPQEVSFYRIEEQAARKAYDTAYQRLRALVEVVDVAGREGVMWADVERVFEELRGGKALTSKSSETASPFPLHHAEEGVREYIINEEMVQCIEAWTSKYPVVSKDIAEAIRSRPFGSVGARGREASRGVGSESLPKESPSPAIATPLTTNCPDCGTPIIEFSNTMMRQMDRCPRCGWKP
jgi:hypothetical protein